MRIVAYVAKDKMGCIVVYGTMRMAGYKSEKECRAMIKKSLNKDTIKTIEILLEKNA